MTYGLFRAAAASPELRVADCGFNSEKIIETVRAADALKAELLVLPELCVTGYTCADLFLQESLQDSAIEALEYIAEATAENSLLFFVGLPLAGANALYNCAAAVCRGKVLGIVPKSFVPEYAEFYEKRWFASGRNLRGQTLRLSERNPSVPFGTDLIFRDGKNPEISIAAEICEDLWVPKPPSIGAALAGAVIVANLSASNETIAKASYRRMLAASHSAKICAGYVYANAGRFESTTDVVFSGHSIIAENGAVLGESELFSGRMIVADIDAQRLWHERRRMTTFGQEEGESQFRVIEGNFTRNAEDSAGRAAPQILRPLSAAPFVPEDEGARFERCAAVVELQAHGLARRLLHTGAARAVIGLSGGLDSTLALMVTGRAFKIAGIESKKICAVTMPCFGTTDRTYKNACSLARGIGAELREIPIREAVLRHFADIGQDENSHDVTYENCQARERTQVLMDIANKEGGLVIGTGDLSELALGWCTYNGDQMSMYGVNGSIPKTLVRHLVTYFADTAQDAALSSVLRDILDTPVSPELLPPEDGKISQKTEDVVGPYRLHDFFLYYMLRFGFAPKKILFLAEAAFLGEFCREEILKWLKTFYRRFFAQQFKRSCMPDGAKVGSVNLSPRGDWRMPSDASAALWLKELESC